jgi:hypothetical protein
MRSVEPSVPPPISLSLCGRATVETCSRVDRCHGVVIRSSPDGGSGVGPLLLIPSYSHHIPSCSSCSSCSSYSIMFIMQIDIQLLCKQPISSRFYRSRTSIVNISFNFGCGVISNFFFFSSHIIYSIISNKMTCLCSAYLFVRQVFENSRYEEL